MPGWKLPGNAMLARLRRALARFRGYGHGGGDFNALRRSTAAAAVVLAMSAATAAAAPPRILAFGDSLTAGYGLPVDQAFPVRLEARLKADGIDVEIINGGVSGDTTAGGLSRLDWALADKPDYVLLELGANDMLRGIDPKVTEGNLDKILARLTADHTKVMLFGMRAAANWGDDYRQEFEAIYPALAAKYKVPLYPFFLDGVALDPTLAQPDGLHPNERGIAILVDRIAPFVERVLADAAPPG
ncbi:MAG: acyl-CoA thioesterase [Rhodospirillales bacterium]|jgi:acyl-CoA thioesterase-1|nr:acyl-CoA thioesterase [Rhodospirillales bacterium]